MLSKRSLSWNSVAIQSAAPFAPPPQVERSPHGPGVTLLFEPQFFWDASAEASGFARPSDVRIDKFLRTSSSTSLCAWWWSKTYVERHSILVMKQSSGFRGLEWWWCCKWPVYVIRAPPWKIGIMRHKWFFKASKLDQVTQCTIVVTSSSSMKLPSLDATRISSATCLVYTMDSRSQHSTNDVSRQSPISCKSAIYRDPTRQNHAQPTLKGQNPCLCAEKGARNMQKHTHTHVVVFHAFCQELASWSQTVFGVALSCVGSTWTQLRQHCDPSRA